MAESTSNDRLKSYCLICETEISGSSSDDIEDFFFRHFAAEHMSAEPMYTILTEEDRK